MAVAFHDFVTIIALLVTTESFGLTFVLIVVDFVIGLCILACE